MLESDLRHSIAIAPWPTACRQGNEDFGALEEVQELAVVKVAAFVGVAVDVAEVVEEVVTAVEVELKLEPFSGNGSKISEMRSFQPSRCIPAYARTMAAYGLC